MPLVDEGFRAYRGSRTISDPRILLARVRALRGDSASADALLGQVLHDVPGEPFALAERLAILPPDAPTATAALDTLGAGSSTQRRAAPTRRSGRWRESTSLSALSTERGRGPWRVLHSPEARGASSRHSKPRPANRRCASSASSRTKTLRRD